MSKLFKKVIIGITSLIVLFYTFYLFCLPQIVSNKNVLNFISEKAKQSLNIDLTISNPELKTNFTPQISFNLDKLHIKQNNYDILRLEDFNANISLKDLLFKRVIIKRLSVECFHTDINKLLSLAPQENKKNSKPTKFDWDIDFFNALIYARDLDIKYALDKNTQINIVSKGFGTNNAKKENRRVYFNIILDLYRNNENLKIALKDEGKVIIDKKTLFINELPVSINNSNIFINGKANKKEKFNISIYSDRFDVKNIIKLINSNILLEGGKEMLASAATNIDGSFDFNFKFDKKGLDGKVNINNIKFDFVPLLNVPVNVNKGLIKIDNNNIYLEDFEGKYCLSNSNKITLSGVIKDYIKTMQMDIVVNTFLTDELMKKHISKLLGFNLNMIGDAGTRIYIKSKNNKFDILAYSRLLPGEDILIENMSLSPKNYERIIKADMHFEDTLLAIKGIDYFVGIMKDGEKEFKRKSIMALSGNVDCLNYKVLDMGIKVEDPLPSEFFNIFAGPKFFRKGFVQGYIHYDNKGEYPILNADMTAKDIRIPSQRLKINEASIKSNKDNIHINAFGRFKRAEYKFDGNIKNKLLFPIIVQKTDLTVNNLDISRILNSFNKQNTSAIKEQPKTNIIEDIDIEDDTANDDFVFDTGLIVIKDCNFHLLKANYNEINMGNLHAKLILDENGVLKINSNKFDFAEGISTLKVICDLMKHNYYVRLGAKDVDSDIIATTLLGLKKEISGKAKGLIELNSDKSLKLNGVIKFEIADGAIGKVGFLEYVLKFASLFRNPMAMISPSTFIDLVNIPEGNFNSINGELNIKNNNVELMKIKSQAPQLSAFIIGCFNLETRDAILRIYTKMSNKNKGVFGFMRNISLNALANRIPLGNSNEENYYSAELKQLPPLDVPEDDCQVFLTKVDGDVEKFNFISSLKRIK